MQKLKVSIIGATGYTGKELVKILMNHPKIELIHLVSSSYVGKNIAEIFPEFLNKLDKKLINLDLDVVSQDSDTVFTALPHTVSFAASTGLEAFLIGLPITKKSAPNFMASPWGHYSFLVIRRFSRGPYSGS